MRSNLFLVVELACDDIAFDSEGMDYTLEQVVDLLLEQAAVKDQPATFKDVMNFGA